MNSADKNQQKYLSGEEQRLLIPLIDLSDDLIFSLGKSGSFRFINKAGAQALKYLPEEIRGKHFFKFITAENRTSITGYLQKIIDTGEIINFEVNLVDRQGKEIKFSVRARFFHNGLSGQEEDCIIGIGKDLSAQQKNIEKIFELNTKLLETINLLEIEKSRSKQEISYLEEINRMRNEFVSEISHEFRTPLASIIGFSETIASDPSMTPDVKKEFIEIILAEGKRLAKLINDVLDYSQLEEGKISLNKNLFDFVKLIEDLIISHKYIIEREGLILSYELPKEEVIIDADRERITQLFCGILDNSIKHTYKGGRIGIFVQDLFKEIEVIITDTGIGIAKKDLPSIFQISRRPKKRVSEDSKAGLGLVFVKKIVDLHNGSINIQSEIERGTTIVVRLPKKS